MLGISTFISYFFSREVPEANIITVYILGVLITAVVTSQRIYSLISSVISVLLFNFLFTEPRYTFNAYDAGYIATFLVMFIAALITSSLAVRIKKQAIQSAETAYRTRILFETNQQLGQEQNSQGIISVTCGQLEKLLKRDIIFYEVKNGNLARAGSFFRAGRERRIILLQRKREWQNGYWRTILMQGLPQRLFLMRIACICLCG